MNNASADAFALELQKIQKQLDEPLSFLRVYSAAKSQQLFFEDIVPMELKESEPLHMVMG